VPEGNRRIGMPQRMKGPRAKRDILLTDKTTVPNNLNLANAALNGLGTRKITSNFF
jgi:hypothetical protein